MHYKDIVTFKHLPHWEKSQIIEAKSVKKAEDIVRHMYKDNILSLKVSENE